MLVVEKLISGDIDTADSSDIKWESLTQEQRDNFNNYVYHEITDAKSYRSQQEFSWIQAMRDYEARPVRDVVNIPIEDAPNIVVPLIAIAAESIYSMATDLVFGASPILTVRSPNVQYAKALQALVNKLSSMADVNFRPATEHSMLDDIILGTGLFYVPWTEATKKTNINKVKYFGPRIYSVGPEDILVPGGSMDNIELLPWIAYRTYPTEHELKLRAKRLDLDIEGIAPAGAVDQVRATRESLARSSQSGTKLQKIYETYDFYCTYDIDGDGDMEDMLCFYDYTSRKVMSLRYNPYERRPFLKMCYQIRAHQFNGMGCSEMLRYLQDEITKIHNHKTLNLILANTRMWASKHGTFPTGHVRVWPNRNIEVSDVNDVKEIKLSDIYPSSAMSEASNLQLAERRVGSELPMPRPSQLMSSRTPATTTMTMLQQSNRRFSPAFDQMRAAAAGAMKHCLFRIQEQLLAVKNGESSDLVNWINNLVGEELGVAAIEALTNPNFDDEVACELTASSATVSRDADKQEMLTLVDRLTIYYEKILQLAAIATNPATPPPVMEAAKQVAQKSAEVLDRVLRTFDSVRDPENLIVRIDKEIDAAIQQQEIMQQLPVLAAMMGGGMEGGVGGEGAPGEAPEEGTAPPEEGAVQ
jgi:muconolactone delta-isomerase